MMSDVVDVFPVTVGSISVVPRPQNCPHPAIPTIFLAIAALELSYSLGSLWMLGSLHGMPMITLSGLVLAYHFHLRWALVGEIPPVVRFVSSLYADAAELTRASCKSVSWSYSSRKRAIANSFLARIDNLCLWYEMEYHKPVPKFDPSFFRPWLSIPSDRKSGTAHQEPKKEGALHFPFRHLSGPSDGMLGKGQEGVVFNFLVQHLSGLSDEIMEPLFLVTDLVQSILALWGPRGDSTHGKGQGGAIFNFLVQHLSGLSGEIMKPRMLVSDLVQSIPALWDPRGGSTHGGGREGIEYNFLAQHILGIAEEVVRPIVFFIDLVNFLWYARWSEEAQPKVPEPPYVEESPVFLRSQLKSLRGPLESRH